jgi:hypothetical protein
LAQFREHPVAAGSGHVGLPVGVGPDDGADGQLAVAEFETLTT